MPDTLTSSQLTLLTKIENWMDDERNENYRSLLNRAVFSTANQIGVHPNDLAIYILIRTSSL